MNIVIDGQLVRYISNDEDAQGRAADNLAFDDMVSAGDIVAIESYPSMTLAPAALSSLIVDNGCEIVAIWTGAR